MRGFEVLEGVAGGGCDVATGFAIRAKKDRDRRVVDRLRTFWEVVVEEVVRTSRREADIGLEDLHE